MDIIAIEHSDKTSSELDTWCKAKPTGDIVGKKIRQREIKSKLQNEKQTIAETFLNTRDYPKCEAGCGRDVFGEFVKIYLDGREVVDDG